MGHKETYRHNESYAEFLSSWDRDFYRKYAEVLGGGGNGKGPVLDVGCGVGQVMDLVRANGIEVVGVDVSEANLKRAGERHDRVLFYDGEHLPFRDDSFQAVGAFNVLEHVEAPESFILELARVLRPGGRLVLSSPNFFRVIGFRDYHPRMRGPLNKIRNALRLVSKMGSISKAPDTVRFDRMQPIVREPFQPDDDAVIATNPVEMRFFIQRSGCVIERVECTDRPVHPVMEFLLNATPLKYGMFNSFVVGRKGSESQPARVVDEGPG